MNYVTKFSDLAPRWGGRVSLLPRVAVSRNLLTSLLLLALMLWIVFPAVAQDATPTPDIIITAAPDVVTDIPSVVSSGDTMVAVAVVALTAALAIVTFGSGYIINAISKQLGDSVKTEQLESFMASAQKWLYQQAMSHAAKTPYTWDEGLIGAVAGAAGYNPAVGASTSPRPLPPAPPTIPSGQPIPPAPVEYKPPAPQPLGVPLNELYDLRKITFTEEQPPKPREGEPDETHRRIAVPTGYAYYADGGDTKAHTDAFYDPDEGFKMNIDSRGKLNEHGRGAQYGYESLHPVELYPGTRYTLTPRFDAKLSGGAVNIRAALLDGDRVLFELPPQRIEPGTYANKSVVFVFQLSATKSIFHLRLRVYVETEYATLRDDSYIRWRMLPLEAQAPDYGNDAVVRY